VSAKYWHVWFHTVIINKSINHFLHIIDKCSRA
jgi:hypothetical protein